MHPGEDGGTWRYASGEEEAFAAYRQLGHLRLVCRRRPAVTRDPDWEADLKRYSPNAWLQQPSLWAIALYRMGRRAERRRRGPIRWILRRWHGFLQPPVELLTGISLPVSATIGPGLRIHHFGGIVVHRDAVIGAHCTMRHGVTIGEREHHGPVPVLEDDVELGVYAQVLGGVHVGSGAMIGAMSVVLDDVPRGATVVGNPAHVILGSRYRKGKEPIDAEPAYDFLMP